MSRPINREGIRYGRLIALKRSDKRYGIMHSRPYWDCRCDCGKETTVYGPKLESGHTKSCGCLTWQSSATNLVGTRAGCLLAVKRIFTGGNGTHYECQCDCGKQLTVPGRLLINNQKLSCGCRTSEFRKRAGKISALKIMLPAGESCARQVYQKYKYGASIRGIDFELSLEEFMDMSKMDCHYCGCKPSNESRGQRRNGSFIYNGVDRMDNSKGYTHVNSVPCCRQCNIGKRSMTIDEFFGWVNRIYRHNASVKESQINWNVA